MKAISIVNAFAILALSCGDPLIAQTNTFPASGNVGIGTLSPGNALDVIGGAIHSDTALVVGDGYWATAGMGHLALTTYGGADILGNTLNVGALSVGSWIQAAPTSGLFVGGNSVFGGIVGIGTPNPQYALDVNGQIAIEQKNFGSNTGLFIIGGTPSADWPTIGFGLTNSQAATVQGVGINGQITSNSVGSEAMDLYFTTRSGGTLNERVRITSTGNVGIGTSSPAFPLSVNGTVEAKEVLVQAGWSDYVFEKSYHLAPLADVARTIASEKHLPGMPSAKEVAAHGVNVGEMETKLLAEVEELTLRQIDEERRISALEEENQALKRQNTESGHPGQMP